MECPKCGHVQADGPPECARCGLIFARWVERRSQPQPPRPPSPAPTREPVGAKASPVGLAMGGAGTLILGLAVWHFWFGGGLPADRDAWRDAKGRCALVVPSEWVLVTPANASALLVQTAGHFPPAVEAAITGGGLAAVFRPAEPGAFAPWASVAVLQGVPRPLHPGDAAALAAEAAAVLETRLEHYQRLGEQISTVDHLPALRIWGTDTVRYLKSPSQEVFAELPGGGRYPIGRTEDVWDVFDRSIIHWLIPARGETFLLTLACPTATQDLHAAALGRIVDSFRVLKRPPLYGRLATPALRAAATVLLAVVLLYTLTEAAALRRRF